MSLQLAAQHLSNSGRGNDSTLVHMSPREVKSLNDLAMAHGGQLSINPQTGLPEAGFLSSILPMVAGAALMAAGVPAGYAALGVGAGTALMTGSLEKGLMAGLGAYGGANLGSGLLASGTDVAPAVLEAQQAQQAQQIALKDQFYNPTGQLLEGKNVADYATQAQQLTQDQIKAMAGTREAVAPGFFDKLKTMGSGISSLGQEGGLSSLYQNLGGSPMSLLKSVGSAAAPAISEAMKPKPIEEEKSDADLGQRYGFSMNPAGGRQVQPGQDPFANAQSPTTTPFPVPDIYGREQRYFSPSYKKLTAEEAKELYGFADGGVTKSNNTLTPEIATYLMQASMTGGAPTSEFNKYGGYDKVSSMYETGNGSYAKPAQQTGGSNYTPFTGNSTAGNSTANNSNDTPALQMFKQLQAEREAQPPVAQIDAKAQFQDYLKQTVNPPKPTYQPSDAVAIAEGSGVDSYGEPYSSDNPRSPNDDPFVQPQTPPAAVNSTSELIYDPIKQRYTQNPNFAAAGAEDESTEEAAPTFSYTGVPYSNVDPKTGKWTNYDRYGQKMNANGGLMDAYAGGGMSHLGDYSDGGRLLRGPGDGVSDSIPAMIGKRQPARLADGEFVVPARIVSELGNGSTEAGARKLYAMMDRIQKARGKTVGKGKVAKNSRSEKYLPV